MITSPGQTQTPAGFWPISVLRGLRRPGRRRRAALATGLGMSWRWALAVGASLTNFGNATSRRYIRGALFTVLFNVASAAAYLFLLPPSYVTRWTLILPTASSSASMQLESIGHAQTTPSSPFGSTSMSPKVIYKEIADSEPVRLAAAKSLDMKLGEFGRARIKLIDETSLMLFEMTDRTAAGAQRKGEALIDALNQQLDALRRDEIARRAEVVETSLKSYKQNLTAARNRILEQQRETGVVSINQFNETATALEMLRRKRIDVSAELGRARAERALLIERLGVAPEIATQALQLSADQAFLKLALEYADANTHYQQERRRLGEANPVLVSLKRRVDSAMQQITHGHEGVEGVDIAKFLLLINGTHQADLLKGVVASEAQIGGKQAELAALEQEIVRLTQEVKRMSVDVARLEDLKKDHLVAEAVFTSALARIDTNKTDIYASYPMVQILSPPDLPENKSSPRMLFAVIGCGLGIFLYLLAWGLAWLRDMFSPRRSKSA